MKEKELIKAIQWATKTAQGGSFDAARAERDALLYLGGFLEGAHPRVSNALTELLDACSELRVAKKVELNQIYGAFGAPAGDLYTPIGDKMAQLPEIARKFLNQLVEATENKKDAP